MQYRKKYNRSYHSGQSERRKPQNELLETPSKCRVVVNGTGNRVQASHDLFWFSEFLWVEKVTRVFFFKPNTEKTAPNIHLIHSNIHSRTDFIHKLESIRHRVTRELHVETYRKTLTFNRCVPKLVLQLHNLNMIGY